jgi:glycosyltransferase involved in cell wall biosynthesis
MEPVKRLKETISIALCTYNGERFLPRQLASILEQTRLPDEMVVCDDGSTDGTLEILHDFADQATFPVEVIRNGHTLGSSENFVQAIGLCEGTFIALSDQDDIWYPSRLERSEQELNNHPEAALLFFRCRPGRRTRKATRIQIMDEHRLFSFGPATACRGRIPSLRRVTLRHRSDRHAPLILQGNLLPDWRRVDP